MILGRTDFAQVHGAPHPSALHTQAQLVAYLNSPFSGRYNPATLRAAWWTWRSVRSVKRRLSADGVRTTVRKPPAVPVGARQGVDAVLRRTAPTCLERCLVYQAWLAACALPCEVVVGIAPGDQPGSAMDAHAWLDFESDDPETTRYQEIHRISPHTSTGK